MKTVVLRTLLHLLIWLPLASPAPATTRLTLKDGTVYILKEPPQVSGGRIVFTTIDGKVLSAKQDDVQSIGAVPKPTAGPPKYNPQDSRALGAIARQEREREGKTAEVAPRAARKATPASKKTTSKKPPRGTPTPRPTP